MSFSFWERAPSRFEGLPGAVVEAQTAGLKCLIADAICEEVAVTELVETMSIEEDPAVWSRRIRATQAYGRRGNVEEMKRAGFDVAAQAERMMRFYERGGWE